MSIKFVFNDNLHKVNKIPVSMKELHNIILTMFQDKLIDNEYNLAYEDEDSDIITLSSELDYHSMIEMLALQPYLKIHIKPLDQAKLDALKRVKPKSPQFLSTTTSCFSSEEDFKEPKSANLPTLPRKIESNASGKSNGLIEISELQDEALVSPQVHSDGGKASPPRRRRDNKAFTSQPGFTDVKDLSNSANQQLEDCIHEQSVRKLMSQSQKILLNFHPTPSYEREELPFTQMDENAPAHTILIHEPSVEVNIATLHPAGALYEGVTDLSKVLENYKGLRIYLRNKGIRTVTVKEALMVNRERLENLAFNTLTYEKGQGQEMKDCTYISDDYKRKVISQLTMEQLTDIVFTQPTYVVSPSDKNTPMNIDCVKIHPVGNLIFCRDQQITTRKGIVMSRLNSEQRAIESQILKVVHENLGATVIGEAPKGAFLEGGDFMILKPDIALLHIGLRSNLEAAKYLMENDLLGTQRFGLVIDTQDFHQDRMHLDTIFNIVSRTEVVLLDMNTVDPNKDLRRKVMVFKQRETKGTYGNYHLVEKDVDFEEFLVNEGFRVCKVCHEDQLQYIINFLNLGSNTIMAVNRKLKGTLENFGSKVKVDYIEFGHIKRMYGAAHCATQVFRRDW
jgi:arginine deiminase